MFDEEVHGEAIQEAQARDHPMETLECRFCRENEKHTK